MALGKQIQTYRKRAGWTLEQLAEKSGVEVGTISALEQRDSERSKYTGALARAFGLTTEQLADESVTYPIHTGASGAAQVLESERAPYTANSWPFSTARQMFDKLPEREQARVDGYIAATVHAWIILDEAHRTTP